MAKDPIVEETRAIREELARAHGYDVHEIARALRREEAQSPREIVTLTPRRISPAETDRKAG